MSKIDEVRADMVKAMKAKDKDTKETLSMLLAALKNKAIDKRADLTPEEETQVILKEIKQTKETLDMTPADRTEIIEECNKRLAVLEQSVLVPVVLVSLAFTLNFVKSILFHVPL